MFLENVVFGDGLALGLEVGSIELVRRTLLMCRKASKSIQLVPQKLFVDVPSRELYRLRIQEAAEAAWRWFSLPLKLEIEEVGASASLLDPEMSHQQPQVELQLNPLNL